MSVDEPSLASSNAELARTLDEIGRHLADQGANPFRVRAYHRAADVVRNLDLPVERLLDQQGLEGLEALPSIGRSLARTLEQLVRTGRLALLDRLRGEHDAEHRFATILGIGPRLAQRIHEQLGIESLSELERAAGDGRLARVPGMGAARVRGVHEALAGRFRRTVPPAPRHLSPSEQPPVAELLDVDREYREQAALGRLPRIAPRRFNPSHAAWLPVLHTQRGERHYTVLFSNTARAHELDATRDWVVIYRDDAGGDGQWTVITAHLGSLAGQRIVRGRERECRALRGRPARPLPHKASHRARSR
jgi:DNA polymerase (family 10)